MLTATFDKAAYNAGDTITLTIVSDKRLTSSSLDVAAGGETVHVTTTVQSGYTVTDPNRKWTVKSDDGKTVVLTSIA